MRYLGQFTCFNFVAFADGKEIVAIESAPWMDFNTKEILGTRLTVAIIKDETNYGEKPSSNQYEKFTVKVKKQIAIPMNTPIVLVNPEASVYGDYHNMLSVKCDDVQVVNATPPQGSKK